MEYFNKQSIESRRLNCNIIVERCFDLGFKEYERTGAATQLALYDINPATDRKISSNIYVMIKISMSYIQVTSIKYNETNINVLEREESIFPTNSLKSIDTIMSCITSSVDYFNKHSDHLRGLMHKTESIISRMENRKAEVTE